MDTPPKPPLLSSQRSQITAKTPFQSGSLYQRSFKSELQPNRRFCADTSNPGAKSGTRFYASTSQRPIPRKIDETKHAEPKVSGLMSRLGNVLHVPKPQPKPHQIQTQIHQQQQPPPPPKQQPPPQKQQPPPTKQQPPQPQLQSRLQPHQPQHQPYTNKLGPLATATKAPISLYQHTQPTPQPNNRSNHQISRAHSEPSIKYQVKVNEKVYKILRKIGSGGSAKVYEGFEPQTCQTVAVKIINVAKADQKTQESYFNEIALLTRLQDCKHVVRIRDSEYKAECKELVIVMEKGDADLSQVIDSHPIASQGSIDGLFIKFYWREMVEAVHEIHQHGIVHADLKPVNFILVKNNIKLIDFGIASAVDPGGTSVIRDYQVGTINYMAPETLRNRATDENHQNIKTLIKYNSKVDIWSLGCILYNLVYGRPPFDKYHDILSKVQAITNPRQIINFPAISNEKLLNCMKSCLRYNPIERPSASDLLNDPFLNEDLIILRNYDSK